MSGSQSPEHKTALGTFVIALVNELGMERQWSSATKEGFTYWPHWVGQTFRYESKTGADGRPVLFVDLETDWLIDSVSERLAELTAVMLNIDTNVGTAVSDGTRVRFRTRVRVSSGPVGPSLLADAAFLQAYYVWIHGAHLDHVAQKYGGPARSGVPHRTEHPISGLRTTLAPVFARRALRLKELQSCDPPLRIDLDRIATQWSSKGFGPVENGLLDGWLGVRHVLDDVSGACANGGDVPERPGLDVAVARVDVSVTTRWFGPVFVARTIVPVPEWVTDDIGFAGADRFNASELTDVDAPPGVGSWSFDRPARRWVYTSLHPRAWLKPYYPDALFGAMNMRAAWWLSTQRAQMVEIR